MKKPLLATFAAFIVIACLVGLTLGIVSVKRALIPARTDRPLAASQTAAVLTAISLIQRRGLAADAALATTLRQQGKWRAASPSDVYIAQAERGGDTPFAYTLAHGTAIVAVVLAPRFFTDTTPTARAALMIHEMGHVRAYLTTGRSGEYDGYKREYDTYARLGLTERDGLTYFAMLDGVAQYVLPRAPAYKTRPDIKAYLAQSAIH